MLYLLVYRLYYPVLAYHHTIGVHPECHYPCELSHYEFKLIKHYVLKDQYKDGEVLEHLIIMYYYMFYHLVNFS